MLRKLALGAVTAVVLPLGLAQTAQGAPRRHLDPAPETDGVIVKVRTGVVNEPVSDAADAAMPADAEVATIERRGSAFSIIRADRALKRTEAQKVASALEQRSDVLWAEPNARVTIAAAPPIITDDPMFGDLTNLWDSREPGNPDVVAQLGENNFPVGGYSAKAPSLWRSTRGTSNVVVAVVDTGAVEHPDLTSRVVGGHDFVSRSVSLGGTRLNDGHDGNGWDSNWRDAGDYNDIYVGCGSPTSSWHGSHVAGTVAAADDNAEGVVGVAPDVRLLAVRVLGVCGGTVADIVAGIRWAAGLPVTSNDPDNPAPPLNPNPADVINLSLGGSGPCGNAYQDAIDAAVAAGTTVVAAAGNNNSSTITPPGNCNNTITVVSTSEYGSRAAYSNHGNGADVAAPGGDYATNPGRQIWSTVDVGGTTPAGPGYNQYQGTSMATPLVAGAIALLYSLGPVTPGDAELVVEDAVAPFPPSVGNACAAPDCGTGILDLSRVSAPILKPRLSSTPAVGRPVSLVPGTWTKTPPGTAVQWERDGTPIGNAHGSTYTPTAADAGRSLTVAVRPTNVYDFVVARSQPVTVLNSSPSCQGRVATRVGTAGADTISGTAGSDVIAGLGGNDTINASGGNDLVCAGDGNDTIYGQAGSDKLYGQAGNDKLYGSSGNDYLNGGPGADYLNGRADNDTLYAKDGTKDMALLGGTGTDYAYADAGDPTPVSATRR